MALHHPFSRFRIGKSAFAGLALALSVTFVCPLSLVRAQDAFHCIDELSDDQVQYRIDHIEENFRKNKKKAKLWRYLWMIGLLGLGGVETWLAIDAHDKNKDWNRFSYAYLAAGSYLLGLSHVIIPAPDIYGHKRISKKPDSTEEERRLKLEYATQTLEKSASIQEFIGGPFGVATGVIFGVVGGSIKAAKWTGTSRWLTSVLFLAPPVVTGLKAATAPRHSVEFWEGYRSTACSAHYYDSGPEGPEFDLSALGAGRLLLKF